MALVDDAHRLALAAGNGLGSHQVHIAIDAQHGLQVGFQLLLPLGTSVTVSENISGVISTCTSSLSLLFSRLTII